MAAVHLMSRCRMHAGAFALAVHAWCFLIMITTTASEQGLSLPTLPCFQQQDVVFVLDASSSITNVASGGVTGQFLQLKQHVMAAVSALEPLVARQLVRIAVVTFSTVPEIT